MELVIAVILGVILLIKFGSDKNAVRITRKAYDKKQQVISEWKSVVTDRSLEQRLKSFIHNPDNKEQVSEEVAPVYEGIFVSNFASCFQKNGGANQKQDGRQSITSKSSEKYV